MPLLYALILLKNLFIPLGNALVEQLAKEMVLYEYKNFQLNGYHFSSSSNAIIGIIATVSTTILSTFTSIVTTLVNLSIQLEALSYGPTSTLDLATSTQLFIFSSEKVEEISSFRYYIVAILLVNLVFLGFVVGLKVVVDKFYRVELNLTLISHCDNSSSHLELREVVVINDREARVSQTLQSRIQSRIQPCTSSSISTLNQAPTLTPSTSLSILVSTGKENQVLYREIVFYNDSESESNYDSDSTSEFDDDFFFAPTSSHNSSFSAASVQSMEVNIKLNTEDNVLDEFEKLRIEEQQLQVNALVKDFKAKSEIKRINNGAIFNRINLAIIDSIFGASSNESSFVRANTPPPPPPPPRGPSNLSDFPKDIEVVDYFPSNSLSPQVSRVCSEPQDLDVEVLDLPVLMDVDAGLGGISLVEVEDLDVPVENLIILDSKMINGTQPSIHDPQYSSIFPTTLPQVKALPQVEGFSHSVKSQFSNFLTILPSSPARILPQKATQALPTILSTNSLDSTGKDMFLFTLAKHISKNWNEGLKLNLKGRKFMSRETEEEVEEVTTKEEEEEEEDLESSLQFERDTQLAIAESLRFSTSSSDGSSSSARTLDNWDYFTYYSPKSTPPKVKVSIPSSGFPTGYPFLALIKVDPSSPVYDYVYSSIDIPTPSFEITYNDDEELIEVKSIVPTIRPRDACEVVDRKFCNDENYVVCDPNSKRRRVSYF